MSRKEARALGLKKYNTGKPCKRGHVADRWTSTAACAECCAAAALKWQAANPGEVRYRDRKWTKNNQEKVRAWRKALPRHSLDKNRRRAGEWQKNNSGRVNARNAKRRALKSQATPPWANQSLIGAIYERAHDLGLHVDHVIPLRHKLVCGLDVPFNLPLVTGGAKKKKGNHFRV